MTDEQPTKSDDLDFLKVTRPRRISIVAFGTAIITLAGAIAFATTLNGRVKALEEAAEEDRGALLRIERVLCMMCVEQIGASSCSNICRTGSAEGGK